MEIWKSFQRYAKVALLALLCTPVYAGDIVISKFGGLNTKDSTAVIADDESQDLLNVSLTPGGKSVFKRSGYGLYANLSVSTSAVHGGYHFQDTTGNDIQLWGYDRRLAASVSGAAFVDVVSSDTLGATWQCADSQGFAYCANSARDTVIKTAGTSATTTFQTAIPLGTMVTFTPDRLIVAGVSGNENTLYASKANTFNNFTTGPLGTDSFTEPIAAPGSRVTHIRYAFGKLFWWKDQSFGFIIFTDQFNLQVITVSDTIGTLDNSSAYWNGNIYFRGQDNHFYAFDGSNLTRLSRAIAPTVTQANRRKANSWTQTTGADFGGGLGYTTFTDTSTSSGDVQLYGQSDQFTSTSAWTSSSGTWTTSGGVLTVPSASMVSQLSGSTVSINSGWYLQYKAKQLAGANFAPLICAGTIKASTNAGYYACMTADFITGSWYVSITTVPINSTNGSSGSNPNVLASSYSWVAYDGNYHTIAFVKTSAGNLSLYFDNVLRVSTNTNSTSLTGLNQGVLFTNTGTTGSGHSVDEFYLKSSTGTYYSAVNNAPNLTTWSTFGANNVLNDGTISYFVRSSTNPIPVTSSTYTWTAQTVGSIVTVSTGTYFQMRADFAVTAATQNPTLSDFTFNWYEGSASDKSYIHYFNDAILFSVALGTSTTNNRTFRFDLLNNAWLYDDIAANGFLTENNLLYLGDPAAGKVYLFGASSSDNGTAINSYWKSKDFTGQDPFVKNEYLQNDFIVKSATGTTLSATYTIDTSSAVLYTINLADSNTIIRRSKNLPQSKLGGFYNIKFGDNSSNTAWEVLGFRTRYNPLSWKPE